MQVDESIYCSTLDSLEPDSDLTSPSGRLVLDYEDSFTAKTDGDSGQTETCC